MTHENEAGKRGGGRLSVLGKHMLRALPPVCDIRRGALIWAFAMMAASFAGFWFFERSISGKAAQVHAIFFVGGLIAWPFALYLARLLAMGRTAPIRFAASLFAFSAMSTGFAAAIFSQAYRSFYAQWHMPITTRPGIHQFIETSASAVYQFLLFGLRLYFPLGILFFLVASLWLMRRMR